MTAYTYILETGSLVCLLVYSWYFLHIKFMYIVIYLQMSYPDVFGNFGEVIRLLFIAQKPSFLLLPVPCDKLEVYYDGGGLCHVRTAGILTSDWDRCSGKAFSDGISWKTSQPADSVSALQTKLQNAIIHISYISTPARSTQADDGIISRKLFDG